MNLTEEQKEILKEGLKKVKRDSEAEINWKEGESREKSIRKVHVCEDLEKIIK